VRPILHYACQRQTRYNALILRMSPTSIGAVHLSRAHVRCNPCLKCERPIVDVRFRLNELMECVVIN